MRDDSDNDYIWARVERVACRGEILDYWRHGPVEQHGTTTE